MTRDETEAVMDDWENGQHHAPRAMRAIQKQSGRPSWEKAGPA
jgi:hypothetical protein